MMLSNLVQPLRKPCATLCSCPLQLQPKKAKITVLDKKKSTGNSNKVSKQRIAATILIIKYVRKKKLFTQKAPDNKLILAHSICQVLSIGRNPISSEESPARSYPSWQWHEVVQNNSQALDMAPPGYCRKINPVLPGTRTLSQNRYNGPSYSDIIYIIYKQDLTLFYLSLLY